MRLPFLVVLLSVACSSPELRPAQGTTHVGHAVVVQQGGLTVAANPESWHGPPELARELVPVELVIDNRTGQQLHFSRGAVALVGSGWALRPVSAERLRRIEPQRTTVGMDPAAPDFAGMDLPFFYEDPAQEEIQAEALAAAIAEGPIADGERRRGFVYFESLPEESRQVDVQVALRRSASAQALTVRLPFVIVR